MSFKERSKNEKIRVAFYIRVSTDEQAKHGYGIQMQKDALKELLDFKAKNNNWISKDDWVFIDDGYSGANLDRPNFKRMMGMVKRGEFDMVATWKIDRVSRNLTHLLKVFEDLQQHGASFYSHKENVDFSGAIGKLTFQIFGALAEFERETIKMRTLDGKIASAKSGNYTGSAIPYGYDKLPNKDKGSTLILVPEEAKWVRKMFDAFLFDGKSYSDIARWMTTARAPKGKAWLRRKDANKKEFTDIWVRARLSDPIYTGIKTDNLRDSDGDVVRIDNEVPQIIHPLVFKQAELKRNLVSETKGKKGGGYNRYLLSRKIFDPETGRNFIGYQRGKGGTGYRRKQFTKNGVFFNNKEISGKPLDDFVWEQITLAINKPEEFFKIYQKQKFHFRELDRLKTNRDDCRNKVIKIGISLDKVEKDYYDGQISQTRKEKLEKDYQEQLDGLEKEINEIDREINKISEVKVALDALEKFSASFKKKLDNLTLEEKIIIVELLVDRVEVYENKKSINIKVLFRFEQDRSISAENVDEPETGLNKRKTPNNGRSSSLVVFQDKFEPGKIYLLYKKQALWGLFFRLCSKPQTTSELILLS